MCFIGEFCGEKEKNELFVIPDELDIIIDKKPQEYIEEVLGCFDFDDETLEEINQLEMEQWLGDYIINRRIKYISFFS